MSSAEYERYKEYTKRHVTEWQKNNPEKVAARGKRYRARHRERILKEQKIKRSTPEYQTYQTAYRLANKERIDLKIKLWRLKNKEKVASYNRKYLDRKRRGLVKPRVGA